MPTSPFSAIADATAMTANAVLPRKNEFIPGCPHLIPSAAPPGGMAATSLIHEKVAARPPNRTRQIRGQVCDWQNTFMTQPFIVTELPDTVIVPS
jgi:hypothetical protein